MYRIVDSTIHSNRCRELNHSSGAAARHLSTRHCIRLALSALFIAACGGGDGESTDNEQNPPPEQNRPPVISGSPGGSVVHGTPYSFVPTASDPDGDTLSFSASALPAWASFDDTTGTISGTPEQSDIGVYPDISVSVSDGSLSAELPAFEIEVLAVASGSLTVSWTAPSQSADGSTLTDLAGYRVRWGTQSGAPTNMAEIDNPSISRYVIENLTPSEYFIVVTAYDTSNNESENSNEARGVVE